MSHCFFVNTVFKKKGIEMLLQSQVKLFIFYEMQKGNFVSRDVSATFMTRSHLLIQPVSYYHSIYIKMFVFLTFGHTMLFKSILSKDE